ncbi:malectin domain-containing carbohydrate-binding protein [Filimonas lacunae]|uniref:malectin domain-containing carbohydrate-binding protein n=1 Tax=Filimonas lacunae TaxID=477680 RepID=UPI000A033171|nr:malectin domain-containing carbohydrate-binding protein [Filimonas lacunae]
MIRVCIQRWYCSVLLVAALYCSTAAAQGLRRDVLLEDGWRTTAHNSDADAWKGFEATGFKDAQWAVVSVPHTWDKYEGYRQLKHGNRHGYAWYRKTLVIDPSYAGKQLFLWFEGVNSFATVWVNGKQVGSHAGGRTSFTIDITEAAQLGKLNTIAVKADHPGFIRTLPWVCGGCSEEQGFSEGSQPMGIFRPVHLVATDAVRVEPFGIHVWSDSAIKANGVSKGNLTAEIKNYSKQSHAVTVEAVITDSVNRKVFTWQQQVQLAAGETKTVQTATQVDKTVLWCPERPYLYKATVRVIEKGVVKDALDAKFGYRYVQWLTDAAGNKQLLLNGKPVFLNGTAEYEHLLGNSHAFTATEVYARAMQVKAAGFNAFRDAHQPHNLRYQQYWDSLGILWWPQFSAHIWFDLPEFAHNFKTLMRDWIRERWNSPSIILWGLENESTLPESFARECSDIIRDMDKTASTQRLITTCNGGTGTDWNVLQNWTGTYGGDPADYGSDLMKQGLVGEYGAWRSIDMHTEGCFDQKGPLSEDRMTQLMEMKVRLADSVKAFTTGHFHWLLYSHDNPGRVQPDEGYRYIDKVGPVNNKGLFTIWGEPTDAFYMYRANFTSPATQPMVYIVSHTWPERWLTPGVKSGITVYSNCDEVELFNDMEHQVSLGKRKRGGIGSHFQWDDVPVQYNVLYAQGYVNGKPVAQDHIVLLHLPKAPHFEALYKKSVNITQPAKGYYYRYRVNCGGADYTDVNGNEWIGDQSFLDGGRGLFVSQSWGNGFDGMTGMQASQRHSFDAVVNSKDWPLFQTCRYGRDSLYYNFWAAPGRYRIELYFTEPWYGTGGGMDCSKWRVFDVAVNGKTVIKNLDIWKEAGINTVVKKVVEVNVKDKEGISISFPGVQSSQAVIAAIAIAATNEQYLVPTMIPDDTWSRPDEWRRRNWLDKGDLQYADDSVRFHYIPSYLFGDEWVQTVSRDKQRVDAAAVLRLQKPADIYLAVDKRIDSLPSWMKQYQPVADSLVSDAHGGTVFRLLKKSTRLSTGGKYDLVNMPDSLWENGKAFRDEAEMYTVIVHYPSAYEKAEKIKRPVTTYLATDAVRQGKRLDSTIKGFTGKGYIPLRETTDTAAWKITVGVGDTYELRLRYRTGSNAQEPVWLTIRQADGTLMRHDKVFFAPADTKWKTFYTTTGTNINAGVYMIQLVPVKEGALFLDKLEVQ